MRARVPVGCSATTVWFLESGIRESGIRIQLGFSCAVLVFALYLHRALIFNMEVRMENLEMLTGTFPVAPDQLAHDLAVAKLIKSGAVPASASGYTYYGAYIKYLREFETVIANRIPEESENVSG